MTQGSGGGAAVTRNPAGAAGGGGVARTGSGDVYAGRDGNVYKKQDGGGWQQSNGSGGWNDVQQPTQAQRDQAQQTASGERATGHARVDYESTQSRFSGPRGRGG